MIPGAHITAWSKHAPWPSEDQVEQDLIISRALIDIFSDPYLATELRFRGGTALNKLHFPEPLRYSEDIDLVRTSEGPIKELLATLREVLRPWLGEAAFRQSPIAPKLIYTVEANNGAQIRLKLEINTRERTAYNGEVKMAYAIDNPWFSGKCDIPTFSNDEMLATKLRALLQRDKGRDLFDLSHALKTLPTNPATIAGLFEQYLAAQDRPISRANAEQRMFEKLANADLLADMKPLARADQVDEFSIDALKNSVNLVLTSLISCISGDPWARTAEMTEKFALNE